MDSQWSSETPNLIPNNDLEASGKRGIWNDVWMSEWTTSGTVTLSNNAHWGTYSISVYSNSSASQVITALSPGLYTFRAWVQTISDPGGAIYLSDYVKQPVIINTEPNRNWYLIERKDIAINNSFLEIRFSTANRTGDVRMRVDDLELIKQPSKVTGINKIATNDLYKIIVDKNNRQLEIIPTAPTNNISMVEIYNLSGNRIYSQKMNLSSTLIINGIFTNDGIYIVKIGTFVKKISL